jgi:hypothetical protein
LLIIFWGLLCRLSGDKAAAALCEHRQRQRPVLTGFLHLSYFFCE